jgi:RES domain-containing protein
MRSLSWPTSSPSGGRAPPMLDRISLDAELRALRRDHVFVGFDAYAFRSIALRHFLPPIAPKPLYAASSGLTGTRFVPPNRAYPSLYVALDAETAYRETNRAFYQVFGALGIDASSLAPPDEVALIGVHARLARMLDLRNREVYDRIGTSPAELAAPWKLVPDAPTQILSDAVHDGGDFEGLIYSSAQNPGGSCLVVFPGRLAHGSFVTFRSRTVGIPDAWLGSKPLAGLMT